jgi:formate/nitrite transporter FocA (FNT family)
MHDSDEREVESEEKQHGEKIEVDEERLPSQAMWVAIACEGRRSSSTSIFSPCCFSSLSTSRSSLSCIPLVAKGIFHVHLGALPGGYLLENLGYTFGFIIVILARQQLFTENTVTAVLPI